MTSSAERAGASDLVDELGRRGLWLATAESLTGGLVAAAVVAVPGASNVFRGGIVAYATDVKAKLLGVDAALLAERGPVDAEVAAQMARGVRERLGADVGISTTGAAGPDAQGTALPGTVFIGIDMSVQGVRTAYVRSLQLKGGRAAVRAAAVDEALGLALASLAPGGSH